MSIADIAVGVSAELKDLLAQRRANELEAQARKERDRTRQDTLDRQAVNDDFRERQAEMNEATHALTLQAHQTRKAIALFDVARDTDTVLTLKEHDQILENAPHLAPALTEFGKPGWMDPEVGQGPTFDVTGYKALPDRASREAEARQEALANIVADQYGDIASDLIRSGGTLPDVVAMLGQSKARKAEYLKLREAEADFNFDDFTRREDYKAKMASLDPLARVDREMALKTHYHNRFEQIGHDKWGPTWNESPRTALGGPLDTEEWKAELASRFKYVKDKVDQEFNDLLSGAGAGQPSMEQAVVLVGNNVAQAVIQLTKESPASKIVPSEKFESVVRSAVEPMVALGTMTVEQINATTQNARDALNEAGFFSDVDNRRPGKEQTADGKPGIIRNGQRYDQFGRSMAEPVVFHDGQWYDAQGRRSPNTGTAEPPPYVVGGAYGPPLTGLTKRDPIPTEEEKLQNTLKQMRELSRR
jgi:hypothetical protein